MDRIVLPPRAPLPPRVQPSPLLAPRRATDPARLGIVVVNFRQPVYTIECLESLLRLPPEVRIVVVDNGSEDGSLEALRAWASGEAPYAAPAGPLARLTTPPVRKPVALVRAGPATRIRPGAAAPRLTLLESPENLGFAGGNNLGTRYLLSDPRIDRIWYVNNDAIVAPGAVEALLGTFAGDPKIGMAGTTVRYYDRPGIIQARNGARFSLLTGNGRLIGNGEPARAPFNSKRVVDETGFVTGASLAITRDFWEAVGEMSEAYFLYYEEIDWATRGKDRFRLGYARGATVYHRHGGTIGSAPVRALRSPRAEYWMLRSRLRFYATHYPALWPFQWLYGLGQTLWQGVHGRTAKLGPMVRALLSRPLDPSV
ncbi:MAG: glycosyltransferase family 2 protein [Thermaurantiacus tibetensis]|uniref:glycosyltransferase family 2 protein n=1 Tax=Thermaurantiacus tibetensis TaxID=2759035 RepID=UPI00188F7251|nr:glycosyltransferase family 2 protein [Thermaurantiacus tibetensis]